MFFAKITSCFLSVLYTLSAAFAFIPEKIWYTEQPYTVEDSDSILFSAAVIADTHSDSSFFPRQKPFVKKNHLRHIARPTSARRACDSRRHFQRDRQKRVFDAHVEHEDL